MILFILEGSRREPMLFHTLEALYFPEDHREHIIYSYCDNIYNLYTEMVSDSSDAFDIVALLKEKSYSGGPNPLAAIKNRADIPEVFLIFDYDCQDIDVTDSQMLKALNTRLAQMLEYFNDETGHGKLFINYPMVEAIRYTKQLPDKDFPSYTVSLNDCKNFKDTAAQFSAYKSLDFLMAHQRPPIPERARELRANWQHVICQNTTKANLLCKGVASMPARKTDIAQADIFRAQLCHYILQNSEVAILSAFPLFLYDYFSVGSFMKPQ